MMNTTTYPRFYSIINFTSVRAVCREKTKYRLLFIHKISNIFNSLKIPFTWVNVEFLLYDVFIDNKNKYKIIIDVFLNKGYIKGSELILAYSQILKILSTEFDSVVIHDITPKINILISYEIPNDIFIDIEPSVDNNFKIITDSDLTRPKFTLKNIHKKIKCSSLSVSNPTCISGNVLGILNYSKLFIHDSWISKPTITWGTIVFRYRHDILECQDKLIEYGFEEYARL